MNMKWTKTNSAIGRQLQRMTFRRTRRELSNARVAIVNSSAWEELITRLPIEKNFSDGAASPRNNSPAVITAMMRKATPRAYRALMYLSGR